jgi:hypothetical protein
MFAHNYDVYYSGVKSIEACTNRYELCEKLKSIKLDKFPGQVIMDLREPHIIKFFNMLLQSIEQGNLEEVKDKFKLLQGYLPKKKRLSFFKNKNYVIKSGLSQEHWKLIQEVALDVADKSMKNSLELYNEPYNDIVECGTRQEIYDFLFKKVNPFKNRFKSIKNILNNLNFKKVITSEDVDELDEVKDIVGIRNRIDWDESDFIDDSSESEQPEEITSI